MIVRGPILTGLALARIRFRVSAEPRHTREAAAPAGSSRVGSPSGLRIISGRGPNNWQISRAIERAERTASPGMTPMATAAIVATQGSKSFMVPCPVMPTRQGFARIANELWAALLPVHWWQTARRSLKSNRSVSLSRPPCLTPYQASGARRVDQGCSLRLLTQVIIDRTPGALSDLPKRA